MKGAVISERISHYRILNKLGAGGMEKFTSQKTRDWTARLLSNSFRSIQLRMSELD